MKESASARGLSREVSSKYISIIKEYLLSYNFSKLITHHLCTLAKFFGDRDRICTCLGHFGRRNTDRILSIRVTLPKVAKASIVVTCVSLLLALLRSSLPMEIQLYYDNLTLANLTSLEWVLFWCLALSEALLKALEQPAVSILRNLFFSINGGRRK